MSACARVCHVSLCVCVCGGGGGACLACPLHPHTDLHVLYYADGTESDGDVDL